MSWKAYEQIWLQIQLEAGSAASSRLQILTLLLLQWFMLRLTAPFPPLAASDTHHTTQHGLCGGFFHKPSTFLIGLNWIMCPSLRSEDGICIVI